VNEGISPAIKFLRNSFPTFFFQPAKEFSPQGNWV
jgi:hypothetical protein